LQNNACQIQLDFSIISKNIPYSYDIFQKESFDQCMVDYTIMWIIHNWDKAFRAFICFHTSIFIYSRIHIG
jgi:hypothetical protein